MFFDRKALLARLLANGKQNQITKCVEWQGLLNEKGYGRVRDGKKVLKVHRAIWMLLKGDPGDLLVLHNCDNPCCYNIDHLFLGTAADNTADMLQKGRARGKNSKDKR